MSEILPAGANRPVPGTRIELRTEHADPAPRLGVAVLPLGQADAVWLPLDQPQPGFVPQMSGPSAYTLELAGLNPATERVLLALYTDGSASTLRDAGPIRAHLAGITILLEGEALLVGAVVFAELYRRDGAWKIRAKSEGVFEGVFELGRRLGLSMPAARPTQHLPAGPAGQASGRWGGTAFQIGPAHLITNAHVVDEAKQIEITGFTGRHTAHPMLVNRSCDLALLRLENPLGGTHLSFRLGSGPILGETVVVVGYPLAGLLGSGPQITQGMISNLLGPSDDLRMIQLTAPVQPGSSGGPILDSSGLVIGIFTGVLTNTQNVNFGVRGLLGAAMLEAAGLDVPGETARPAADPARIARDCRAVVWRVECRG